jgi:hypothetical protein
MNTAVKTYTGHRLDTGCEVYVSDQHGRSYPLPLHLEIRNHSPTGFGWGYGGSGPAQLALAILADHFGPEKPPPVCPYCGSDLNGWKCSQPKDVCGYDGAADDKWAGIQGHRVHYQLFKRDIISNLADDWQLTSDQIDCWATASARLPEAA